MVYEISYDLNKAGKNYDGVMEVIKAVSTGKWMHYLDSTWFIQSYLSAKSISDAIQKVADCDDCWIVCEITRQYYGRMNKDAWPCLESMF